MTTPEPMRSPLFRLSPELRLMIYEKLLIQIDRPLRLIKGPQDEIGPSSRNNICTSILRTCRAIYNEALPILYGSNTLLIRISPVKEMIYLPKHCLALLKHVSISATPFEGSDSLDTACCLQSIADGSLDDLSIHIYISYRENYYFAANSLPHVLESFRNNLLVADNPILRALLSLTSVKKLYIELENGARFEPGFADILKETFMKTGSGQGRSIVIRKRCTHQGASNFENGARCPDCANTMEEIANGTADWEYKDDTITHKAVTKWTFMRQISARYRAKQPLVTKYDGEGRYEWRSAN